MAGYPWYTNGKIELQIKNGNEVPDGFVKGRLPRSEESRRKQSESSKGRKGYWVGKKMPPDSRGETLKRQFASGERVQWNLGLKGDPRCKGHKKGTPSWNKGLTRDTDERVAKYLKGWEDGTSQQKQYNTKKKNNSFNISYQEDDMYKKLCEKYGEMNVLRNYSEERYPFSCDFYITTEDLFIEFNRTWTHGGHPFDPNNEEDIQKLEKWKEKAKTSDYYKNAIYTWTDLDVRKQKVARENKIKYQTIY